MDKFIATVISLALYILAARYLQRAAKKRVQSVLYGFTVALGGVGAVLLVVSAVIPNGMPSALAFLLLGVPMVLACLVLLLDLVRS